MSAAPDKGPAQTVAASASQAKARASDIDLALERLAASRLALSQALGGSGRPRMASASGAALLQSVVREHPFAAVGVAAAVGALAVRAKPWRSLRHPAVVAALGPLILSAAQSHPGSMWLDLLMAGYEGLSKPDQ